MADKETVTVVNQTSSPIMLKDGTQVGAAYTPEGRREVTLSPEDRQMYVDTPEPALTIVEAAGVAQQPSSAADTTVLAEAAPPAGDAAATTPATIEAVPRAAEARNDRRAK